MANFSVYPEGKPFRGVVGQTAGESEPAWPAPPRPREGAPNVIMAVLDDVGYAQVGCFGGLGGRIRTPHMDRLAAGGAPYSNFHVTALCSPTRAALLTGRNHHSVGIGSIMERATGYPGYNGRIPKEAAMISAVLQDHGVNTLAIGKWHLTPPAHTTPVGPFGRWPLGQGFDRFYGFLSGEADQWDPILYEDNRRVEAPSIEGREYHLTVDLIDHSIQWIDERKMIAPSRPFFMHLAFGAAHAPHHAPREWIESYRGVFDSGWDVIREETLVKQKELGLFPQETRLPDRNPGVEAWADLTEQQRTLFTRQMEVYAGFMSHTDDQLGRLLDYLEAAGELDNTLIVLLSDNGASAEGGPNGLASETSYFNGVSESVDDMLTQLDQWGDSSTFPHYATGWAMAGSTPNRLYKSFVHEGGTRVPFIAHWPAGISDPGVVRNQFHSATDLVPTILDVLRLEMPSTVRGHDQMPLAGVSMAYSFNAPAERTRRHSQYFEMHGHRAMWKDGWKAVTFHWSKALKGRFGRLNHELHDGDFDADLWELYQLDADPSEMNELSSEEPEKLKELIDLWWEDVARYQVLPLDDRTTGGMFNEPRVLEDRDTFTYRRHLQMDTNATPSIRNRSHTITISAHLDLPGSGGTLVADGGPDGGYVVCVLDGKVHYAVNYLGREYFVLSSKEPVAAGDLDIQVEFTKTSEHRGRARLSVNGEVVDERDVDRTNPVMYGTRSRGLRIGMDSLRVWPEYSPRVTFAGVVKQVDIRPSGSEHRDPAADERTALHRQ